MPVVFVGYWPSVVCHPLRSMTQQTIAHALEVVPVV
jgi:hypothetical protein